MAMGQDLLNRPGLREAGEAALARLGDLGMASDLDMLAEFDPLLPIYVLEFQFGEVLARTALDDRTRLLCAIAAFLADRNERSFGSAVEGALRVGVKATEIVEVVIDVGMYAGFHLWTVGAEIALKVFRANGVELPKVADWRKGEWKKEGLWDRGSEVSKEMFGPPRPGASGRADQAKFDPAMPNYVVEVRFAELMRRPGLDVKTRHLCALATYLATNEDFASAAMVRAALNNGASREEIADVVVQTGTFCGLTKWAVGASEGMKVYRDMGVIEE